MSLRKTFVEIIAAKRVRSSKNNSSDDLVSETAVAHTVRRELDGEGGLRSLVRTPFQHRSTGKKSRTARRKGSPGCLNGRTGRFPSAPWTPGPRKPATGDFMRGIPDPGAYW